MNRAGWFGVALMAVIAFGLGWYFFNPRPRVPGYTRLSKGSDIGLLSENFFAEELNLTSAQRTAVDIILEESREKSAAIGVSLKGASREERMAKDDEQDRQIAKQIDAVLNEQQQARFQELRLQMHGSGALTDKAIAAALKLSDRQTEELVRLTVERSKAMQEATDAAGGELRAAIPTTLDFNQKRLDVLTAEQKEAFAKMQGKRADWPETLESLVAPGRYYNGTHASSATKPVRKESK